MQISICTAVYIICVVIWFFWMLYSTCTADKALRLPSYASVLISLLLTDRNRKMPYLATRFRQLSFRFFVAQTWLIIVYFVVLLIVQTAQGQLGSKALSYPLVHS